MKLGVLQFFSWPERRVDLATVYARALERIEIMDRTGYDAVWLAEHHFSRPVKEDTNEIRESNRRRALQETLLFLAVRSVPGGILAIFGAVLLAWICCKFLPIFPA